MRGSTYSKPYGANNSKSGPILVKSSLRLEVTHEQIPNIESHTPPSICLDNLWIEALRSVFVSGQQTMKLAPLLDASVSNQ